MVTVQMPDANWGLLTGYHAATRAAHPTSTGSISIIELDCVAGTWAPCVHTSIRIFSLVRQVNVGAACHPNFARGSPAQSHGANSYLWDRKTNPCTKLRRFESGDGIGLW